MVSIAAFGWAFFLLESRIVLVVGQNGSKQVYFFFFFFFYSFYTGVVQLSLAGLPLTSCFGSLGHLLWGGHPNVHFRCCHCRDSNPDRVNANNNCRRLNDVGHPDPQNISYPMIPSGYSPNENITLRHSHRTLFSVEGLNYSFPSIYMCAVHA